jgi:hypothetical protein
MAAFSSVAGRPLADPGRLHSGAQGSGAQGSGTQSVRRRGGAERCHANPAEISQTRARAGPDWRPDQRASCGPPPASRAAASLPAAAASRQPGGPSVPLQHRRAGSAV